MAAASIENQDPETPEEGGHSAQAVRALEGRIDALQNLIQQQGDATGQIGQLIQGLQSQLHQQQAPQPKQQRLEPSEEFQKFYDDMPNYIRQHATEGVREALGPHLAHQAVQTRDSLLEEMAERIDGEHGDGFFQEHMAEPISQALQRIPLEMQASRDHVEAATGAALGRLYLDPEARQAMESARAKAAKAREEEAMNLLPNGRPRPKMGDQLEDRHRTFLDSLRRNGIDFSEQEYKTAMQAGTDIKSWRAAKASASKGKAK